MWIDAFYGGIPLPKNMSAKKLARLENDMEFLNTFADLFNSALNVFKWNGLPETCNERFLERSLLMRGSALIVKEGDNFLNLACVPGDGYNLYGDYTRAYGYGLNGWNKKYSLYVDGADASPDVTKTAGGYDMGKDFDAVMCRDNKVMFPYINYLILAARRKTETMRSMDVALQNLKMPVIITCEDSSVNNVKEVLAQRDTNVAAVVGSGSLPVDAFKVWDTKANPAILQVMWEHYERLDNHVKELIGVNSLAQVDKKERLLVDEVNANNQSRDMNIDKRLKERELFCERLNKAFGLNVSVEVNIDPDEDAAMYDDPDGTNTTEQKEGENNVD